MTLRHTIDGSVKTSLIHHVLNLNNLELATTIQLVEVARHLVRRFSVSDMILYLHGLQQLAYP